MPEYVPQPQLPAGMAQEVIRLANQRAQIPALGSLYQGLGGAMGQIGQAFQQALLRKQQMAQQQIPTAQAVALGLVPSQVGGRIVQTPQGPITIGQTQPAADVFGPTLKPGVAQAAESIATQKAVAERMMQLQKEKEEGKKELDMVPLTPELRDELKKKGIVLPDSVPTVHRSLLQSAIKPSSGTLAPTEDEVKTAAESMAKDGTPLSLSSYRDKTKVEAAYQKMREKNKSLPTISQLEINFKAEQSRARTMNSQATQSELVAVDQFNTALDVALENLAKIKQGDFIPLNKAKNELASGVYAAKSLNAEERAKLSAAVSEIAMQGSRVFSGTAATDIRFKQELERFNTAQSPGQIKAVAEVLRNIANTRKSAILGMKTYTPQMVSPSGGQTPSIAPASTASGDDYLKSMGY